MTTSISISLMRGDVSPVRGPDSSEGINRAQTVFAEHLYHLFHSSHRTAGSTLLTLYIYNTEIHTLHSLQEQDQGWCSRTSTKLSIGIRNAVIVVSELTFCSNISRLWSSGDSRDSCM